MFTFQKKKRWNRNRPCFFLRPQASHFWKTCLLERDNSAICQLQIKGEAVKRKKKSCSLCWDVLFTEKRGSIVDGVRKKRVSITCSKKKMYELYSASMVNWVVVSNIFYFHPYLGKIPILTSIFFRWVETTNQLTLICNSHRFLFGTAERRSVPLKRCGFSRTTTFKVIQGGPTTWKWARCLGGWIIHPIGGSVKDHTM